MVVVEKLRREWHRSTTRRMYHEAWCNFNDFLITLDKWPDMWEDRIALFIADLMGEHGDGHPSSTVASYVSATHTVLKDGGVEIEKKSVILSSLLRSCRLNNKSESTLRLPIRHSLMHLLIDKVEDKFLNELNQPFLSRLYKAILMIGYYGLLRVGEMTASECNHYVRCADVHIAPERRKILIILRLSKTYNIGNALQIINIGLTIPGNWSFEIRRISPLKSVDFTMKSSGFHLDFTREIWWISPMKSSGFHPDFM